jgi:hypothetical protein
MYRVDHAEHTVSSAPGRLLTRRRTIARPLSEIGPPDALEVYPLMFIGVIGSTLVSELVELHVTRALTVAVFAYCFAGTSLPGVVGMID